jgi:sterol 3beta-glucosyltransferase
MLPQVKDMQRRLLVDQWNACRDAKLLLYHPKALGGAHIAEKLGIPGFCVPPFPAYVPTGAFPMFIFGTRSWGAMLNRLSFSVTRRGQAAVAGIINDFRRQQLELPARARFSIDPARLNGRPIPVMHPISPYVLPRPADWPEHIALTGYWFLDAAEGWTPPDGLLRFLDSGAPPVYIGFGSMVTHHPDAMAKAVLEAIELIGARAILGRGWGGLQANAVPDKVHLVDDVPHDWLLPRCAAVVHHGGAGSTAAGLRAGLPTLVVPHIADQPLWGKRVQDLGVGPPPLSKKQLRPDTLSERIDSMLHDKSMQTAARDLGAKIRSESGTDTAIAFMNHNAASV